MRGSNLDRQVAANLRRLRLEAGVSQRRLAQAAGLGENWVNEIECCRCSTTLGTLEKLAFALGVAPIQLLQDSDDHLRSDDRRVP